MEKFLHQIGISNINYDNRINLLGTTTLNIVSTINSLNNTTLGVSINNHTTSINNLGSTASIIDGKVGTIIGVSIPQFLTRNETTLPSTFRSSNLNTLGTSGSFASGAIDTNGVYDLYIGGIKGNPHTDTNLVIAANGQDGCSSNLYFGTPFGVGNNGNKTAIMCQGISNTSIGKLFFCLNNNTSTHNINASLSDAKMSLDANGLLNVSGNLTISGTLQSLNDFNFINKYQSVIRWKIIWISWSFLWKYNK